MSKNFMQNGKWIDSPREATILVCTCGGKYIKTRAEQTQCLPCTARAKAARV